MMQTPPRVWEKTLIALLISWIIVLHLCCFFSAGALWRDEANSARQARFPSWESVWDSLRFDSFPVLYPAILRLWSSSPWGSSDLGLRMLGIITGLSLLASIWIVGRWVGGRAPLIAFALFAADPVLISEGDSIRPYGISVLFLVWLFGSLAKYLGKPAKSTLVLATLAAVLAVQTSYTNALFVAVLSVCAAGVAVRQGSRRAIWLFFLPGLVAAASLLPYAGLLRQARDWASILHVPIEWLPFLQGYVKAHSIVYPLVWAGFALPAFISLAAIRRDRTPGGESGIPSAGFSISAAVTCLLVQISFVEAAGVPPFPRYFLPSACLIAVALEVAFAKTRIEVRALAAIAALFLTAAPSWIWLRQRHTNMDQAAAVLEHQAQSKDIIVISPWFLHTSFQRYYHGSVDWITVPVLEHFPMMRYDLIKASIQKANAGENVESSVETALRRGGAVWFISQRVWTNLDRLDAPEKPLPAGVPGGADYVRFRSYWERGVEYALRSCCRGSDVPLPAIGRICDEEDLMLTRWSASVH